MDKEIKKMGYICMPLKQNIPEPRSNEWELTTCPNCGNECWVIPLPKGITEAMFNGRLCTSCALKAEISIRGRI